MERAAEAVLENEDIHTRFPGYRNLFDGEEGVPRLHSWPVTGPVVGLLPALAFCTIGLSEVVTVTQNASPLANR